jgi:RND family efflux transporter MFP subunit
MIDFVLKGNLKIRLLLLASLLVVATVFAAENSATKNNNNNKANANTAGNSAKTIEADTLQAIAIYPEYKAPATVITLNDSQISSELAAVVDNIAVEVGQLVKKGDLLVSLRKKDFQLALQREQAALDTLRVKIEFADYQLQRAQKLEKQKAVSEELLKQRETDLAVLLSENQSHLLALKQAKRNLEKCDLRAPFDAVINEKLVGLGELANPGTPLLRIIDAQQREVTAELQSYQLASLRSASTLIFKNRSETYPLQLRSVLPVVDARKRTQEVRLTFSDDKALVGTSGELVWKNTQAHVPAEMLVQRNGQLGIFIVNGNNLAKFMVIDDAAEGRPVQVDFSLNTKIVTKGRFRLQDGDAVNIL